MMNQEQRLFTAAMAMAALIARGARYDSKKQLVDNAITYADMLARRLGEIPQDATQRCEAGQTKNKPKTD